MLTSSVVFEIHQAFKANQLRLTRSQTYELVATLLGYKTYNGMRSKTVPLVEPSLNLSSKTVNEEYFDLYITKISFSNAQKTVVKDLISKTLHKYHLFFVEPKVIYDHLSDLVCAKDLLNHPYMKQLDTMITSKDEKIKSSAIKCKLDILSLCLIDNSMIFNRLHEELKHAYPIERQSNNVDQNGNSFLKDSQLILDAYRETALLAIKNKVAEVCFTLYKLSHIKLYPLSEADIGMSYALLERCASALGDSFALCNLFDRLYERYINQPSDLMLAQLWFWIKLSKQHYYDHLLTGGDLYFGIEGIHKTIHRPAKNIPEMSKDQKSKVDQQIQSIFKK